MAIQQVDTIRNAAGTGAFAADFGMINYSEAAIATDANLVMTIASKNFQAFNISVTRDVTLPTTSVKAGAVYRFANRSDFDLVIKASNGSALTVANSANRDATIRLGWVVVIALVDTPTTPAQWFVSEVSEKGTLSLSFTGAATISNQTYYYNRTNSSVVLAWQNIQSTGAVATNLGTGTGAVPTRLNPSASASNYFLTLVGDSAGGGDQVGLMTFESNGRIRYYKTAASGNFSASGTIGPYASSISYVTAS